MTLSIPGIQIEHCVSESGEISIYSGRSEDNKLKNIKVAQARSLTSNSILKLELEFQILNTIKNNNIPQCFGFNYMEDGAALILEYMGDSSLANEIKNRGRIDLIKGLQIGLELLEIIATIHNNNIIHKAINPLNIACSSELTDFAIINFAHATYFNHERAHFVPVSGIDGMISYMAPEQTGRMNREMDYRADYYSFGVTLYEIFTGVRPFASNDPLTIIHGHLAVTPKPAHEQNDGIPEHLSRILSKLLSKSADDRYQSIEGIRADLQTSLNQVRSANPNNFELGTNDSVGTFHLPQKLYGRSKEKKQVQESFQAIAEGGTAVLLISGLSGIGKTVLVQEIHPEITRCGGLYCAGKFEQLGKSTPYSALIHACNSLLEQTILASSNTELWKQNLVEALGHNAQVIVDFLPAIKPFVECEPIQELGPVETQNRFKYVFSRFIKVFCKSTHPLVLFLDDLQWMDLGTLRLLEHLLCKEEVGHFLLVGCFRSNELHEAHPLRDVMLDWMASDIDYKKVDLLPIGQTAISQIVMDVFPNLNCDLNEFTKFIVNRTGGNPFFLRHFLSDMYLEGWVTFDLQSRQWKADLETLKKEYASDAVIEFMGDQLKKFPLETRKVLNCAACIGSEFDISTLTLVLSETMEHVHTNIMVAVEAGLLIPNLASLVSLSEKEPGSSQLLTIFQTYRFQHDQVQKAAYMLEIIDKKVIHLKVGENLLSEFTDSSPVEKLFTLVYHLNESGQATEEGDKQNKLFELNMNAAESAIKATSYESAFTYLQKGKELLPENRWIENRIKAFRLCRLMAEVKYLLGDHDEAIKWMDKSLDLTFNNIEKAKVYNQKLIQLGLVGKYWESVKTAFIALELLGISIDYKTPEEAIDLVYKELSDLVNVDNIEDIYNSPVIEDESVAYALKIIAEIMSVTYAVDKRIFVLISLSAVLTALKYGICADVAPAFSCTGLLHIAMFEKPDLGIAYGELGKKLGDRFDDLGPRSKAYDWYCNFVVPWAHPLSQTEALNREAFSLALDTGDLPFAGFIANHRSYNTFYMGLPLGQVINESERYLQFCERISHHYAFDCIKGILWICEYLQNAEGNINTLPLAQEEFLVRAKAPESLFPVGRFLILLMQVHVLEGNGEKAWCLAEATENLQEHVTGTISSAEYRYYRILAGLLYCAEINDSEKLLQQLEEESVFFSEWANRNPHTFSHKNFLLKAEIASLRGKVDEALSNFDLAIIHSRENNFAHEEALSCERAANFWLSQERQRLAQPYIREAYIAHRKWGCHKRMSVLKKQYPDLLNEGVELLNRNINDAEGNWQFSGRDIGLDELLRSVSVISEARNLNQLNKRALKLLMGGGGADVGALFIVIDAEAVMTTYALVEKQEIQVEILEPIPTQKACNKYAIPMELLKAAQTKLEPVIINSYSDFKNIQSESSEALQSKFNDDYPKSMICHPVLSQGELSGMVFLGNTVTEQAFTHDRLQIMKALAGQLSVSIKNVMLYEDLERLVLRRTKALELANSKLKRLSNVDGLTNLYNRRYFDQALEMEIDIAHRRNYSLSLIMCDIDHFKNYNDYYGHVAGDQCIRTVASILLESCQRTTDISARYGGEEFAVILPNTTNEQALIVAKRIQTSLAKHKVEHCASKEKDIVSLSMGIVSLVPQFGSTAEEFITFADEAMYESKHNGRDRIVIKKFKYF